MKAMFDDFDNIDDGLMEGLGDDLLLPNEDALDLVFEPNDLTTTMDLDVSMGDLEVSDFQMASNGLDGGLTSSSSDNEDVEASEDKMTELLDDELLGDEQRGEVSFLGHSQGEINQRISQAQHKRGAAESDMRHFKSIAESKARMGEPHGYEDYQYSQALRRYREAQEEINKWRHIHPDK